jgi:hypothetical protein
MSRWMKAVGGTRRNGSACRKGFQSRFREGSTRAPMAARHGLRVVNGYPE